MKVALIGLGHWGSRLIPRLLDHARIETVYAQDIDDARRSEIAERFPEACVLSDLREVLRNPAIDAVVIATPVSSHYPVAKQALEHDKHVLMEKPLTNSVNDALGLVRLAKKRDLKLMVDHITVYSGAVAKLKNLVDSKELGKILYFDAVRSNLGMIQTDVNVVWDLAIHDFAVLDRLVGDLPFAVSAVGSAHYGMQEEIAHITLYFENDLIAHVHVSWISPVKTRRLVIGGDRKMVVFDDTSKDEKLFLFDSGVDVHCGEGGTSTVVSYRSGVPQSLAYDQTEPLTVVLDTFVSAVEQGVAPLTCGEAGLRLVKILAAADRSMKQKGAIVPLDQAVTTSLRES
jgi:predicted dehydrogenase